MSFYYALEGIIGAISEEVHLRFHIAVGVMITIFAYFYRITPTQWAILLFMTGAVISAELVNTGIERAVDCATSEITPAAKMAKDTAAGAVLVLAAVSVLVGFCLFGNSKKILNTLIYIFTTPWALLLCFAAGAASVAFVIFGGKNVKKN